jgi:hypothetical protein
MVVAQLLTMAAGFPVGAAALAGAGAAGSTGAGVAAGAGGGADVVASLGVAAGAAVFSVGRLQAVNASAHAVARTAMRVFMAMAPCAGSSPSIRRGRYVSVHPARKNADQVDRRQQSA